jgi:replicative DNA helicase
VQGASEFGTDFQRVLVRASVVDVGLRSLIRRYVDSGSLAWTDPAAAWAWRVLAGHDNPSLLHLRTESARLTDGEPLRVSVQALVDLPDDYRDQEYVRDQVVEWARRQTFVAGFDKARAAWNNGDHSGAYTAMMRHLEDMQSLRLDSADRGWFFAELADRQARREDGLRAIRGIPSGIHKLDEAMGGGLSAGELEVPIAYSGIGKSFWCVQRGYTASRLRLRTLHFVLEGGRAKTEDRYEARFTDSLYREVRVGEIDPSRMAAAQREYHRMRDLLVVRGFGDRESWQATYEDLLTELRELRTGKGWIPDLIVVDYGDLLWAPGDNEYARQKTAFRQLKALSERVEFRGHRGYAVCSPSQAQRPGKGADEREHVLEPRDIADCYEKVRVADAILSLNRTNEEKEQNLARVHLGKYRDAEDGLTVRVQTDYTRGAFSTLMRGEAPPPKTWKRGDA